NKAEEIGVGPGQVPVEPANLIILAPGIVVALLGAQEFIAGEQHGHALRQEQGRDEILGPAAAQAEDLRIVRGSFHAAIPAEVFGHAVAIVLAVGLIVLLVIGDQVPERKAVVAGHKIDRVIGPASGSLVQVGAAAQTGGQ